MKGAVGKPTGAELRAHHGFISVVSHHTMNGLNSSQSQNQHRSPPFLLLTACVQPVPAAEIPGFLGKPFQQLRSRKPYQSVPHEELLHSNRSAVTPITWMLVITASCEGLGWLQSEPPHAPGEHEVAETTLWCTGTTCCSSCGHRKPWRAQPEGCNFGLLAGAWDAAIASAPLDVGSS